MNAPSDPARRRVIESVFEEALERPREGREEWLAARCADDPGLLTEVEALLRAHSRDAGILDADPVAPASGAWDEDGPAQRGARVGPYRIVRRIGTGGMGTVYLAERADGQFERRAAIKIIRSGPYSLDLHRRFLAERQILASLEHANIARLYDGGFTEDGRPYLAMEHVEGSPIDLYCERNGLDLDERLDLFRATALAVHHAHRNLIIHRDLKPSNILVTSEGEPKLLDFGIAKILGGAADAGPRPAVVTGTGLRLMTPEYASPEQVRGDPLTTASDVYSLGVVLYRLLTGAGPYELGNASPAELVEAVCERDPLRPSERVRRGGGGRPPGRRERLARALRGDLDAIVLKALRKEPSRRYGSAEALVRDIERHLEGLPVTAHRADRRYRLAKFVRRHRTETAAAALAALSLLGGIGAAVWQASTASRARDRAEAARDEARTALERSEEVTRFLLGLFEASDPVEARGDTAAARELLRRGLERAEELEGQPAVQASLFDALGRVYGNLGQFDRAETLLRRALQLRRETLGPGHTDVAASLDELGVLLRRRGRYEAAERLHREALAIRVERFGERHPDVATTLAHLAFLAPYMGRLDEAGELYDRAFRIRSETLGPGHPLTVDALVAQANVKRRQGSAGDAEGLLLDALDRRKRALGAEHPQVADVLLRLGDLVRDYGAEPERADSLYRRALEIQRGALGDDHPALVHGLHSLGSLRAESGDLDGAERLAGEAVSIRERAYGPEHPNVAESLDLLASFRQRRGDLAGAETLYGRALEMWRATMGPRHYAGTGSLLGLARIALERGELELAETRMREAVRIRESSLGREHPLVALAWGDLAELELARGNHEEAERLLLSALELVGRHTGLAHPDMRRLHGRLAAVYESWGRAEDAARERALALRP